MWTNPRADATPFAGKIYGRRESTLMIIVFLSAGVRSFAVRNIFASKQDADNPGNAAQITNSVFRRSGVTPEFARCLVPLFDSANRKRFEQPRGSKRFPS